MTVKKVYDALIIGGGPAGLSMAVSLVRQLYSTLVIDSGIYRNARVEYMHNVPGFDYASPALFRAKIRADLAARYDTVEFLASPTTITKVRKLDSGIFEAVDENGVTYHGKKLGLGTGVRDIMEDQPEGYDECWIKGIFHCLYCHGYEERGVASAGVLVGGLASAPEAIAHVTPMAKRLADSVTVYTNDNATVGDAIRAKLHSSKIIFDNRKIASLRLRDGGPSVQITFVDGTTKTEGFMVNHPSIVPAAPFAEQLGLETLPSGEVKVGAPFNETSVSGCFAAGDWATPMKSVVQAVQMGGFAGVGMATQLQRELDERDEL